VSNRRRLLCCAAASLLAGRPQVFAQPPSKVYRVGFFSLRAGPAAVDEAFVRGMRELGYAVGRNLVIDYRWASNDMTRLQPLADELVRLNVDVIVTAATPAVRAAMRATNTIPIVMAAVSDPVGSGLVPSLGRPGGNVTGMTIQSTDLAQKRLQLIREIVPSATRIGLLALRVSDTQPDTARETSTPLLVAGTQAAAQQMRIGVVARSIAHADELPDAFAQYRREQVQALIVQLSPLTYELRIKIIELAAQQRLPAMYEARNFVDEGGLVSYGPDLQESYRRAATYVDRIFRGAKPGELAIEQQGTYEMVINMKAAKALGITIPQSVLLRADEVIQ
jgi:putative tryptophan/tyrosine transport system substrate-binding protein